MASSAPNRVLAARASAVLTNSEVKASSLDINDVAAGTKISVEIAFTIGSLTNVILIPYVSMDGSTWHKLHTEAAGTVATLTLTGSDTGAWVLPVPNGYKFFAIGATGTDTVTNSLLALNYRYIRRGAN